MYSKEKVPSPFNGVLNLKGHNFDIKNSFSLEGEWRFYWKKFLGPKDLENKKLLSKGKRINIPGLWSRDTDGKVEPFGHATYLLRVKGAKKGTNFSLTVTDVASNFRMYVYQGEKLEDIGGLGTVSSLEKESNPQIGSFIGDFVAKKESFFILIHVSNFHFNDGGFQYPINLGLQNELHEEFEGINYKRFFILGIFLIMGINHFGIYFQRKEDKGSFWFSLFCLVMAARFLSINSHLDVLFPSPNVWSFYLNKKVEYLTFFLSGPIFLEFLKFLFDDYFKRGFLRAFWILCGTLSLITIFTPVSFFVRLTEPFQIVMLLASGFMVTQVTRAALKNVPYSRICLEGLVVLVFGVVWDILIANQIIPPPRIFLFTSTVFVFVQSYIISKKFSFAYEMAEQLNIELEEKVEKRTKEISGLLNNLENSIFSVRKDLRVHPPFSQYSETLFKKDIEGKSIFDFLLLHIEKGSRKYNETVLNFESIFGDDELNYSFIEGNFPQSVILSDSERPEGRTLKISYSPIYDKNELVERLMFIVEDITEFERFYQEAQMDQLSYKFIKEILTIENKKELVGVLRESIKSGLDTLEELLSPKSDSFEDDYFLNNYKKMVEEITTNVQIMPTLSEKIHIKTADFDYTSLMGEAEYGNKKNKEKINYQLEVTDKISDILEYLLTYGNVIKLFYPVHFDLPFDNVIEEKVSDLKILLMNLFEKTFLVRDIEVIDKDRLARMASLARLYPEFDRVMNLIQQRTKFISLLLRAIEKEKASKTFSTLATLFKQMPPQNKLNETVLNQNLILPYKQMLKLDLEGN